MLGPLDQFADHRLDDPMLPQRRSVITHLVVPSTLTEESTQSSTSKSDPEAG